MQVGSSDSFSPVISLYAANTACFALSRVGLCLISGALPGGKKLKSSLSLLSKIDAVYLKLTHDTHINPPDTMIYMSGNARSEEVSHTNSFYHLRYESWGCERLGRKLSEVNTSSGLLYIPRYTKPGCSSIVNACTLLLFVQNYLSPCRRSISISRSAFGGYRIEIQYTSHM